MRVAFLALCLTLSACTQFPDLDGTISAELEAADYPALVPLDPLMATAIPTGTDPAETTRNLQARIAALKARARALQRRSLVDARSRARLRGGIG